MKSVKKKTSKKYVYSQKIGKGLVNSVINKLPIELHLPGGYQYCGPGTKLGKRLARNDPGINPLDAACKNHDIAYAQHPTNLSARHQADKQLEQAAWERFKSKNASLGEKGAAWLVTTVMKGKQRFGMGCQLRSQNNQKNSKTKGRKKVTRTVTFGKGLVSKIRKTLGESKRHEVHDLRKISSIALKAARKHLKAAGGKRNIRIPRVIPIPKFGGLLPLIPIFAGLSALGSLTGAAAGVAKTLQTFKTNKEQLLETNRHNRNMEAIALGKKGNGIFLKPYRKGLGLFLNSKNS